MIKEVIQAKIEVLENIGGYSIEVEELQKELMDSTTIAELKNESYRSGYKKASDTGKKRREWLVIQNRKLYKSIACDFENIENKGILYKSDLLKMPLPAETVNDLQNWFLEMSDVV